MRDARLYRILRPIIKILTIVFFRPKFRGLENIPKEGPIVLAGNHTSIFDCFLLISSTKRSIHFLAKNDLWKGPKKILFANMGLIPVNRKIKDKDVLIKAKEYLNNSAIVSVFPEGTTEKGRGLLSFKIGAVKMAKDTNTNIVPFVIKGKYRLFFGNIKIIFGKSIEIKNNDLEKENKSLRSIIEKMLEDD